MPPFLREDDIDDLPDDNVLILITGSQGEPRSALSRVALDTHPRVALGEGDTVIFSSRVIPGNERAITTVQDNLVRRGVNVMTDADHAVHVSGHPARDELRRLYRLVKPRYSVPVHGERRHLTAHAALAEEEGVRAILMEDGDILNLAPGTVEIVDSAPVGRLVLDENRLIPMQGEVMNARRRLLHNGVIVASLAGRPLRQHPGSSQALPRLGLPRRGRSGGRACRAGFRCRTRRVARGHAARRRPADRGRAWGVAPRGQQAAEKAAPGRCASTGLRCVMECIRASP